MTTLRQSLIRHVWLTAWLLAAVLATKLLIPTGFMPVVSAHAVTLQPCSGVGPEPVAAAMPGTHHHGSGHEGHGHHGKEQPCGFGMLSAPALSGGDAVPPLMARMPGFAIERPIMAVPSVSQPARLRPPLRGPPAAR